MRKKRELEGTEETVNPAVEGRGRKRVGKANRRLVQVYVTPKQDAFIQEVASADQVSNPRILSDGVDALMKIKELEALGFVLALECPDGKLLNFGRPSLWLLSRLTTLGADKPHRS